MITRSIYIPKNDNDTLNMIAFKQDRSVNNLMKMAVKIIIEKFTKKNHYDD